MIPKNEMLKALKEMVRKLDKVAGEDSASVHICHMKRARYIVGIFHTYSLNLEEFVDMLYEDAKNA